MSNMNQTTLGNVNLECEVTFRILENSILTEIVLPANYKPLTH